MFHSDVPDLAILGLSVVAAIYLGRLVRKIGLPSLIGYMLLGTIVGVSVFGLLNEDSVDKLDFVTEIALGFVAFTIGSELSVRSLAKLGRGIILVILAESFLAFLAVAVFVYMLTADLPLSLIFGALAPASAPAGTVAVIQEYHARGKLTKALYAVVGFDDGLAIIIFGFAAAAARRLLQSEVSSVTGDFLSTVEQPLLELGMSLLVGVVLGMLFTILIRRFKSTNEIPALIFGFIALTVGISIYYNLSLILTCMMLGFVLANMTSASIVRNVVGQLRNLMPLLFILFFLLAGAHLRLSVLPSLGLLGLVYVASRTAGLMGGAWLGASLGRTDTVIRKYVGFGILSQAGVAIGLSLIVKQQLSAMGSIHALDIGTAVITTITATSVIFELIGPISAKFALSRAGEIPAFAREE
jgi:Kef-type K+ transport system membrane component KefB